MYISFNSHKAAKPSNRQATFAAAKDKKDGWKSESAISRDEQGDIFLCACIGSI